MTEPTASPSVGTGRPTLEAGRWAAPVDHLNVDAVAGGDASAVTGRRVSGPVQGFGRLWQKTYRVPLTGVAVTPQEAISTWRERYGEFWPIRSTFYAPVTGVRPGEVALISGRAAGLTMSTGVLVIYSDEESFAFMTPEGHPFAGMITFSSHVTNGVTVAQVQLLIRAHDPLVEVGMTFGGHREEDRMWQHTLRALATHLGVEDPAVDTQVVCVDRRRQWRRIGNLRHDVLLHTLRRPFRRGR
jgi:hypothetical protein